VEHDATCPYCGESVGIWIDLGGGSEQSYVEDCAVCCHPWQVYVSLQDDDEAIVTVTRLSD
jgi:hypothetical protein